MYWYRMGAYVGILTGLLLSVPEVEKTDSDGWVPVAETEDTSGDDDWRWVLLIIFVLSPLIFLIVKPIVI